jgi:hypothetical protein
VAEVSFSDPPALSGGAGYEGFRPWLLYNLYANTCAYCLLENESIQIDHYVPQAHAPERANDPTNLLLACPRCNRGKSDYHPLHTARRRLSEDRTGYIVIDVRGEDFARLFEIDESTGRIRGSQSGQGERAAWNIALLNLDLQCPTKARQLLVEAVRTTEALISEREAGRATPAAQAALALLEEMLARRWLFVVAYEISASAMVRAEVSLIRETRREG